MERLVAAGPPLLLYFVDMAQGIMLCAGPAETPAWADVTRLWPHSSSGATAGDRIYHIPGEAENIQRQ